MKLWPWGKDKQPPAPPSVAAKVEIEEKALHGAWGPVYWPEHVNWQTAGRFDCGVGPRDLTGIAWACVNIISQDMSTLRPEVGVLERDGFFRTMPNAQLQTVLDAPNNYMTGLDFIAYIVANLLTGGNLYVYTPRDSAGVVLEMHPLHHTTCRPMVVDGEVFWSIGTVEYNLIPQL